MRSATATPSSSALCASIGPRTTSPIAQTFGRFVRHSSSTSMKPRSSSSTPTLRARARRVRHAADRDDQLVERRRLRLPPPSWCSRRVTSFFAVTSVILHAESMSSPCFVKCLQRFLGDLLVGRQERRQRLQHRDLRAEPAPHAAHLEADHAGADHAEPLRHLGDRERAGVVEHARCRSRTAGQRARLEPVAMMTCFARVRVASFAFDSTS